MNVVTALAADGMGWGDRASTAGIVTLQGMLTIFLVLSILWASIEIMHRLIHKGEAKEKAPKARSEKQSCPAAAGQDDMAIAAAIAAALAASEDDGAVVAAITAAVSAALAEDGYTGAFRVVSFRRVGAKQSRWRA